MTNGQEAEEGIGPQGLHAIARGGAEVMLRQALEAEAAGYFGRH